MTKPLTVGSLFAGIGGFDLAAESIGWRTAWFVEYDANCQHWLAANFPGVPIHGDITTLDFSQLEPVDVLCGGFPCQPASAAGKRLGTADDRWLWPHFARAIGVLRPRYVVAENVPGLLSVNGGRAFAEVLRDLAALGYDAEWDGLSAGDVGSPQERERVWIVAYANVEQRRKQQQFGRCRGARTRIESDRHCDGVGDASRAGREERDAAALADRARHAAGECVRLGDSTSGGRRTGSGLDVRRTERGCESVGDTDRGRLGERQQLDGAPTQDSTNGDSCGRYPHGSRLEIRAWADGQPVRGADGTVRIIPREAAEQGPESPLWPVADGVPGRVARLRAIGNTVVPQCVVEGPFRVIQERERQFSGAA